MANIWKQNRDVTQHPNRNNFDLSFQSHCTFKFGYLYPVFCRRVVPGDSFRLESAFDLKMMPVAFPIQSRVRAHMHFFFVRNKNLWNHWEDWISGLKSNDVCPHPYLYVDDKDMKTGSIHDFLNQPTTVSTKKPVVARQLLFDPIQDFDPTLHHFLFSSSFLNGKISNICSLQTSNPCFVFSSFKYPLNGSHIRISEATQTLFASCVDIFNNLEFGSLTGVYLSACTDLEFHDYDPNEPLAGNFRNIFYRNLGADPDVSADITLLDEELNLINSAIANGASVNFMFVFTFQTYVADEKVVYSGSLSSHYVESTLDSLTGVFDWSEMNIPFYKNHVVPLNALKYRAYESIYRAFYASDIWQPLVIDGQKEYNKFITNDGDGEDFTDYHLFKRNYELDFLTSALPSPQAGPAPMVGISALGDVTIEDENGITTGKAILDENDNITRIAITSPLASVEHGRTAANIAMLGMNINDFRSANSLQRLLEQTMRSGYRYMKFIKGHFDVEPGYKELDMPEFLGGFTRDVEFGTVVSQSDTKGLQLSDPSLGKNLGDFSGLGRVVGGSNHSVTHHFDDYGFVMGIMFITPTPAYSQLLPKENICPTNYLDYYFPEMSQVGMQPIPYTEVAPLQAYLDYLLDPSKKLTDTFGYQRPNYDMVGSVDEVHGLFRTDLRDMLINRIFDGRPELGSKFLEIDPEEVNDIFINQNAGDDVFIGHLAFKISCKRPLPRVHVAGIK